MSDNVFDTSRRFEIFVPSPKARINLGAPNKSSTGPFGYTGMSLQSDANLFIDANKNTLYQTGQSFCGQVGGQWRQFSNAPMFLSATANVTLAADQRVIIASGAGQGQITAMDHGQKMRLVPYNELKLHYVVDTLQTSLFEFFNGRHTRHDGKFGRVKPVELSHFFSKRNRLAATTATASELENEGIAPHEGGFLNTVARSWDQMHRGVEEADLADPAPATVPALGPLLDAGIAKAGDDVLAGLKYGYSGYLKRFDPYSVSKGGFMNKLHAVVVALKRYMHVALKYGQLVQDLPFIRNAIKGLEGVGSIVTASFQAYHAVTDSYPALLTFQRTSDGSFEAGEGGVVDEYTSGVAARVGGVESAVADARTAKVESAAEPSGGWVLADGVTYVLNVRWDGGTKNDAIRFSRSGPGPATMQITAPALSSSPERFTLAMRVGGVDRDVALTVANTATVATLRAALELALAEDEVDVGETSSAVTLTGRPIPPGLETTSPAQVYPFVSLPPTHTTVCLRDTPENRRHARRLGIREDAFDPTRAELRLTPPVLSASGEQERLVVSVDGKTQVARLHAGTTLAETLAAIGELALLATVSGTGNGPITLTTRSQGARSSITASADDVSRFTIAASARESGVDGVGPLITASEIAGLVGSLDGVTVSAADGKVAFEATKTGKGSMVTVSGSLADLIFGTEPKTQTISSDPGVGDAAGFGSFEDAFKTIVSWNHELQKLPEDTRNLTRPLTEALDDTIAAVGALESAAKSFTEVFEAGAPPPPEAIGLLSPGGITLGTPDRIVANGGKGIVFISDGGTGSPDRAKFVLTESWVADIGAWSADFFESKKDQAKAAKRSLGFRVLSDSVVDFTATSSAQLAAMGRGETKDARPDGRQAGVGIGIARVLGSYASEVAGYEKVVISARAPGDAADQAGATGGRVELLGQRLILGAVDSEVSLKNGTKQALTDRATLGTQAIELASLAGAEHMADGEAGDVAYCESPVAGVAWSAELRDAHPETTHVDLHATTQIETVVLPYRLSLTTAMARLGVVAPVEADRRPTLADQRDDAKRAKGRLNRRKTQLTKQLAAQKKDAAKFKADRDNPMKALRAQSNDLIYQIALRAITATKAELAQVKKDLRKATKTHDDAKRAYDDFANDWDTKAFPVLEVTEEKIRLGFVAGSGDWEDFAYLEMTKDGIKMYQPKSTGIPTFDLESKAGTISDGTTDTLVEAKNGKLHLKYKNSAKSGPLKWDQSGNVKIG